MLSDVVRDDYFEWMYRLVCENRYPEQFSHRKLLTRLHDTDYRYSICNDKNRASDGINLRYRYAIACGYESEPYHIEDHLYGECSVLEMMIALAMRCEENIMDDPIIGDRTAQWFWNMIANLGLGAMDDNRFDRQYVDDVIERFLDREYSPDGKGGLFRIRNCDQDLRSVEIWYQLCWYLDSIM